MSEPLDLVFAGSSDFAVPSLQRLAADGHRLRAVLTQPDRPAGRKRRLTPTLVRVAAESLDIPVWTPVTLTDQALKTRFGLATPRIAVAGLNPHAGEAGLFGDEEATLIAPAVGLTASNGIIATGPHPPDTVFFMASRGAYDAVVAMYHDQGLGPLKTVAFDSGVNVTLGLPIVRTSVDHGTAYDLAGTGKASTASLLAWILVNYLFPMRLLLGMNAALRVFSCGLLIGRSYFVRPSESIEDRVWLRCESNSVMAHLPCSNVTRAGALDYTHHENRPVVGLP